MWRYVGKCVVKWVGVDCSYLTHNSGGTN